MNLFLIELGMDREFQLRFILETSQMGKLRQGDELVCNSTHSKTIKVKINSYSDFQLQDLPMARVLGSSFYTVPRKSFFQVSFPIPAHLDRRALTYEFIS